MQTAAAPRVQAIDVCKHYGEHNVEALRHVSLNVGAGRFVALMGPSGCGKSTLLNCIGGLDKPTSGKILIDGFDVGQLNEAGLTMLRREKIGFVFQFFNLLSTLTLLENVRLPLELAGKAAQADIDQRAHKLLSELGLANRAHFYPSQLSGGEMQRTAVARAIIHKPAIILADEPTGNLDTVNGQNILQLLQSLCRQSGETVLMATHSAEAAAYADEVVHMKDGCIVAPALT